MKFKLTVTVEYDVDPTHYGTDDPEKMCAIDLDNFINNPNHLIEMMAYEKTKIEVSCIQRKVKKTGK